MTPLPASNPLQPNRDSVLTRKFLPITIFVVFALFPLAATFGAETYLLDLFMRIMIFAIAALGLDLLVGYGALVSFGHAAFIGIGAYAVAILAASNINEMTISLPVAIAAAAAFAYVTGAICLRTHGVYFIMITLAFGQMAYFFTGSLAPYGGDDGLTIPMRNTLFGLTLFEHERLFYYIVLGCLAGCYGLCRVLVASRFGRVFRGARENATRMATLGFDIYRYQLTAYAISGALGGLAGFLLANATDFVSPAYMSWQRSGELIVMIILGGLGTLHGAIIGSLTFLLLSEWLSELTENWEMIFGPFLVLIILLARGGLLGLLEQVAAWYRREGIHSASDFAAALGRYLREQVSSISGRLGSKTIKSTIQIVRSRTRG
jgi:branched-chain amino acid transport system permease protein